LHTGAKRREQIQFGVGLYVEAFLHEYKLRQFCVYQRIMMKEKENVGELSEIIGSRVKRFSVNFQREGNNSNI
jgi:hypothetical protein